MATYVHFLPHGNAQEAETLAGLLGGGKSQVTLSARNGATMGRDGQRPATILRTVSGGFRRERAKSA